ncbi:MAG: 4-alpha-glucanotransferase, partial [Epsilonproteobacteria bacterium]|nr:4-alpha-glucanotransferase [Campylobacterota bacterium]
PMPLIAEDLGIITDEVTRLRESLRMPGMKIMQFAFEGDADNPYLPHNYTDRCVVYTGTHDNDTTAGWYDSLDEAIQKKVCRYLDCSKERVVGAMVRAALASVAKWAVLPMQDLLELGSEARMNRPGEATGNWRWRMTSNDLIDADWPTLNEMIRLYGRSKKI